MCKNKTYSTLRIIFSSLALIAMIAYSLHYSFFQSNEYITYSWRFGILNSIFVAVPFIALFTFSIIERHLQFIDSRCYLVGIFYLYLVQTIAVLFIDNASDFSVLCCSLLGRFSFVALVIMILRIVVLVLIPIVRSGLIIKAYSLGMTGFLGLFLVTAVVSDIIAYRETEIILALGIDILFHVALFFFSDFLKTEPWFHFLDVFFGESEVEDNPKDDSSTIKNRLG